MYIATSAFCPAELEIVSLGATASPVSCVESLCSSESDEDEEEEDDGTSTALVVRPDEEQLSSPERLKVCTEYR